MQFDIDNSMVRVFEASFVNVDWGHLREYVKSLAMFINFLY